MLTSTKYFNSNVAVDYEEIGIEKSFTDDLGVD
jgi:hypothetical protein